VIVYLDDERPAPRGTKLCRWPEEVIALIKAGGVECVDLDYYLGEGREIVNPRTGMDVLTFLLGRVREGHSVPRIMIHTADPDARRRMYEVREQIERCYHGL
jgi:hypothetical protein